MSYPASGVCFYCSNPINPDGQHVFAQIRHHYKHGGTRESDRNFHPVCFGKFKHHGRPYNPATEYEVVEIEMVRG
jgi:hypothetical protein